MSRLVAVVISVLVAGCAVAPRVIVHDDDTDRIDAAMTPGALSPEVAATQGISIGPDAPPLAPPFPESPPWQRYLPRSRFSCGSRCQPVSPVRVVFKGPGA